MRIGVLFFFCFYGQIVLAQIYNSILPDSIRIDYKTHNGDNDNYNSVIYDTMANSFFVGGAAYLLDSFFTSNPMRIKYEYDDQLRKTLYQEWKYEGGIKKVFVEEQFVYNNLGLITMHKSLNPYHADIDSSFYNSFDSLSLKLKYFDYNSPGLKWFTKEEYEYYPNRKLFHRVISSRSDTTSWKIYKNEFYFYSNSSAPDTVVINDDRYLFYKDSLGRDTSINRQYEYMGVWQNGGREAYSYNNLGRMIKHTSYYGTASWSILDVETWIYDSVNRLKEYEYSVYGGGGNGLRYSYYENGREKTLFRYNYSTHGDGSSDQHSYSYKALDYPAKEETFDFTIYPNPASTNIFLLYNAASNCTCRFNLFNTLGQIVRIESIELPLGYSKIEIPLNSLSKGIYFLTISDGENEKTKKVVIAQ